MWARIGSLLSSKCNLGVGSGEETQAKMVRWAVGVVRAGGCGHGSL